MNLFWEIASGILIILAAIISLMFVALATMMQSADRLEREGVK